MAAAKKQMLNPKERTSYLEELLARMVDPTHDSAKKPEVDEPGAYSHGAERRDHEVTFTISAVKPLGVVERYGLQERAARRVLVRAWADVLLRRVARQERQLLGLRGVHRTALGPVQPGDHAEAVADWGFPNPNPNPSAFASSAAVPRGVACWRTARGLRQAALFAAKRARVDWRAVRREVTAKSWLGDPALPPAAVAAASLSGGAAQATTASAAWAVEEAGAETGPGTASAVAGTAVGMPRAALNKLVGCSARELQRQVEAVRRHVKAKPFCDESRELWGLLNEARRLEDEVRRLDKQLLLACHALELHFSQRPDPFDEAAGVGGGGRGGGGGGSSPRRRRSSSSSSSSSSSLSPPVSPRRALQRQWLRERAGGGAALAGTFNHEVDQTNAGRRLSNHDHDRSSSSANAEQYYKRHAKAIDRRRRSAGPLYAPKHINSQRLVGKPRDPTLDDNGNVVLVLGDKENAHTAANRQGNSNYNKYKGEYKNVAGRAPFPFEEPERPDWQLPGGSLTDRTNGRARDGLSVRPIDHAPSRFDDGGGGGGGSSGNERGGDAHATATAGAEGREQEQQRGKPKKQVRIFEPGKEPSTKPQQGGGGGGGGAMAAARWDPALEVLFAPETVDDRGVAWAEPRRHRVDRPVFGDGRGGDAITFRAQRNAHSSRDDPKGEQARSSSSGGDSGRRDGATKSSSSGGYARTRPGDFAPGAWSAWQ